MITLEDARGQSITLADPPRRIVSLVPSQTELLSSLGLDEEVIGITRFCVRPEAWRETKRIVGGTKLLRPDRIEELKPDLIIANLEENAKSDVEGLEDVAPVYVTNVRTLEDALDMIESVALLVDRPSEGARVASAIIAAFDALRDDLGGSEPASPRPGTTERGGPRPGTSEPGTSRPGASGRSTTKARISEPGTSEPADRRSTVSPKTPPVERVGSTLRAAYLIWREPYMSVGGDTFIHEMMLRGGFGNAFGRAQRYPQISLRDLIDADPDVVFLSSEPFPFREKHRPEIQTMLPAARVELVDGQLFSWYGSRLIHTPDYLRGLRATLDLA